jgi:DNA invertase Pin-like site-specific DNA recombinase
MAHRVSDLDPFILHLFAALAEKERALIATRTKAALAASRDLELNELGPLIGSKQNSDLPMSG